ncbi:hypothetical protein PTSG_00566 [Salpingoeca rosetta]|uniref:S1 motif domain-containing protein n=1 Tax=Salpingoeca rosetta (strain ATCC 50818 / BSB-021) TaxID=946362 RepID=F2TWU7_SALR5|nr:uncharacterized protein PTSG_00566 [Salpingoeca rosetta]EGD72543.1 hypothetical protein PTSG_00566 [Salpingoeca rosetta]|eukprot:XP_004999112.1 hypothetical protein PTSG_00566 [Salpingoeca rosetta]
MFFKLTLEHDVLLPPRFLGPQLAESIRRKLYEDVESKCIGKHGYIVSVIEIVKIGEGEILVARGETLFPVTYRALVFRPVKNEVVDAIVSTVTKMGIFAEVGPLRVFIHFQWIPNMVFDDTANPPCFRTDDFAEKIQPEDSIRIRILGVRVQASSIAATGSLAGDFLGYAG